MATNRQDGGSNPVVERYFKLIRELRSGEDGAVERLLELWDDDGVFEFSGAPPVTGTFVGRNAIAVLYRNRFSASGMPLRLYGDGNGDGDQFRETALGIVETEVNRIRARDDKVVAAWTTTVGTADGSGFQVAGSHAFTFRDGRIATLRIVVSPRPDEAVGLRLEDLGIEDIGRLALAAWAVV